MKILLTIMFFLAGSLYANDYSHLKKLTLKKLSTEEFNVIIKKGTERAFSGKYYASKKNGVYVCKQCGSPLYKSSDKFDSGCGWPSFDDEIPNAVTKVKDADGRRVEILCANCKGHLGHIFKGEGFTNKNIRHCVNSISLKFQEDETNRFKKAYFAGGCFWGVEYELEKLKGVKSVSSGYMGGFLDNPSYKDVVRGHSGHLESVEVVYDPFIVSYEEISRRFFEIHDPTQKNGQGPDIGSQYISAIFVSNEEERKIIQKLIKILEKKDYDVATQIREVSQFYKAEEYHQDYYVKKSSTPYCHTYVKRF